MTSHFDFDKDLCFKLENKNCEACKKYTGIPDLLVSYGERGLSTLKNKDDIDHLNSFCLKAIITFVAVKLRLVTSSRISKEADLDKLFDAIKRSILAVENDLPDSNETKH